MANFPMNYPVGNVRHFKTRAVASDMSGNANRIVVLKADNEVALPTAGTDYPDGVLYPGLAETDGPYPVADEGIAVVIAGEGPLAGATEVTFDETVDPGSGIAAIAGDWVIGRVHHQGAPSAAGDKMSVELCQPYIKA